MSRSNASGAVNGTSSVRSDARWLQQGECPRCSYVGWAESAVLTETLRRDLRERPVEARRIYA